jgi:hypothetical protein
MINVPQGDHDKVLLGRFWEVIEKWNGVTSHVDAELLQHFADKGDELLATIAYAHIAKAAYSLSEKACDDGSDFDPEEFGRRCAEIAREQRSRCHQHCDEPERFLPESA